MVFSRRVHAIWRDGLEEHGDAVSVPLLYELVPDRPPVLTMQSQAMKTRDRVLQYRIAHPAATVREIQIALGISSPSVVHYHLTKVDRVEEMKARIADIARRIRYAADMVGDDELPAQLHALARELEGI